MTEETHRALGLMSGTSLDGLDLCYAQFDYKNSQWHYQVLDCATLPYSRHWQERLTFDQKLPAHELLKLDHDYGKWLGEQVLHFLKSKGHSPEQVDLIASHGHTLYHRPDQGYTFQLGNGPELYAETNITTVCDFRKQDVALGGQGAPLVPIGDELLFGNYDACLNLGGFANISFRKNNKRHAFDICPVNFVLNRYARNLGKEYDEGGHLAASGAVDHKLLDLLNQLEFYKQRPPKSLGAEWVNNEVFPKIKESGSLNTEDALATATVHSAEQIAVVLNENEIQSCLLTGGGAYNDFLIELISQKTHCQLHIPNNQLVEFKEALVFAFMGVLRLRNETNIYSSVTGSKRDHSSGVIYSG